MINTSNLSYTIMKPQKASIINRVVASAAHGELQSKNCTNETVIDSYSDRTTSYYSVLSRANVLLKTIDV